MSINPERDTRAVRTLAFASAGWDFKRKVRAGCLGLFSFRALPEGNGLLYRRACPSVKLAVVCAPGYPMRLARS